MKSKIFDTAKGIHIMQKRTICEVHREMYDCLVLEKYDRLLSLLEEAFVMGIKITNKLVENKLSLPEWEDNLSDEAAELRLARAQLTENLKDILKEIASRETSDSI